MHNSSRIVELDGLRAIAIALVIGCHYRGFATLCAGLPAYGWVGVDVLFIISGFIITTILFRMKRIHSPFKVFYIRRILRIFPIYFLVLALIFLTSFASREHLIDRNAFIKNSFFLQSFVYTPTVARLIVTTMEGQHLATPFWHFIVLPAVAPGYETSFWAGSFSHAWSLSVEEYFYVFWAPVVLLLPRRSVVVAAICIFVTAPLIRYAGFLDLRNYFEFFSRTDMLMTGSLLAIWMQKRREVENKQAIWIERVFYYAGFVSVFAFLALLATRWPFLGRELRDDRMFMVVGLTLLEIIMANGVFWLLRHAGGNAVICRVLRIPAFLFIGEISYTLYLVHVPVYVGITKLIDHLGIAGDNTDMEIALLSTTISIALAKLSWVYLEEPLLHLKDKLAPSVKIEIPSDSMAN